MDLEMKKGKFEPTDESLQQFECPEWFTNGKFGIWAHWGPQCVPMIGDWYARNMYIEGNPMYEYHCKHYGHPSVFGYKDIVPLWKAEKFDPDYLVSLYKKAGAKYIIACAVHHDNFDCWDSKYHKWNSVNIGPKKDIVGMWKKAVDKAGDLHFGVTVHHERSYSWFNTNKGADKEGEFAGVPYDGNNPEYKDFYYEKHDDTNLAYPFNPSDEFVEGWYNRVKDVVYKYDPDLLYTDGGVPFGEVGRKAVANFYNHNMEVNGGKLQAIYNHKDLRKRDAVSGLIHGDFIEGIGVQDIERGGAKDILNYKWQIDTCIGNWYYKTGVEYKSAPYVIKMLCDVVSKNGNLLLNIPIKPDGSIDDKEVKILEQIADWMAVNSEGIYDTTVWDVFKEGNYEALEGNFSEKEIEENNESYRFTKKGNTIYAFCFGWNEKEFVVKSLGSNNVDFEIENVSILGADETLEWTQNSDALIVKSPKEKPCQSVYCVKVETK